MTSRPATAAPVTPRCSTSKPSLDELERTDPDVKAAAESYDAMVRRITSRHPAGSAGTAGEAFRAHPDDTRTAATTEESK